jgi:hypothetical protein
MNKRNYVLLAGLVILISWWLFVQPLGSANSAIDYAAVVLWISCITWPTLYDGWRHLPRQRFLLLTILSLLQITAMALASVLYHYGFIPRLTLRFTLGGGILFHYLLQSIATGQKPDAASIPWVLAITVAFIGSGISNSTLGLAMAVVALFIVLFGGPIVGVARRRFAA